MGLVRLSVHCPETTERKRISSGMMQLGLHTAAFNASILPTTSLSSPNRSPLQSSKSTFDNATGLLLFDEALLNLFGNDKRQIAPWKGGYS